MRIVRIKFNNVAMDYLEPLETFTQEKMCRELRIWPHEIESMTSHEEMTQEEFDRLQNWEH